LENSSEVILGKPTLEIFLKKNYGTLRRKGHKFFVEKKIPKFSLESF
jgi:hypothetical protein